MHAERIEDDTQVVGSGEPGLGGCVWVGMSRRLMRLTAFVRVQANAHGVPALAALLMQGIVM